MLRQLQRGVLFYQIRDSFFLQYFFNETPWRPQFIRKKDALGPNLLLATSHNFWFIQNKTVFEWEGAIFHNIKQVKSGRIVVVGWNYFALLTPPVTCSQKVRQLLWACYKTSYAATHHASPVCVSHSMISLHCQPPSRQHRTPQQASC